MICCVTDPDGNVTYKSGHFLLNKDESPSGKMSVGGGFMSSFCEQELTIFNVIQIVCNMNGF